MVVSYFVSSWERWVRPPWEHASSFSGYPFYLLIDTGYGHYIKLVIQTSKNKYLVEMKVVFFVIELNVIIPNNFFLSGDRIYN